MTGVRTDTVPHQREQPGDDTAAGRYARAGYTRDPGGRTVIGGGVVEKAALQAIREVPGALVVKSRAARTQVSGDVVLLRLRIGVHYPRSVREIAGRVREHVRHRVEQITGKEVHHIDIEIAELVR